MFINLCARQTAESLQALVLESDSNSGPDTCKLCDLGQVIELLLRLRLLICEMDTKYSLEHRAAGRLMCWWEFLRINIHTLGLLLANSLARPGPDLNCNMGEGEGCVWRLEGKPGLGARPSTLLK